MFMILYFSTWILRSLHGSLCQPQAMHPTKSVLRVQVGIPKCWIGATLNYQHNAALGEHYGEG